jgi:ribosome-binding factor A
MRQENESSGLRHIRLQELMLEELRGLLRDDVSDPALHGVRINALVLSVDYRHARIHYALQGTQAEARQKRAAAERAFVAATPFIRVRLADAIEMRRVPDLRFVFDAVAMEDEP